MRRRDFLTLLGGGAAAHLSDWPIAARAQQQSITPVIGYMHATEQANGGFG
jgi:hypothetical protein